tara:strand:- start:44 stop:403 length:360 start_codon:yes stop_codon:yes gene_type:complete
MSTITVTNIKATGETASRSATSIAGAWIIANQISVADSFNTSGTTDHGTGIYTYSFTNDFSSTNYAVSHTAGKKAETFGLFLEDTAQRTAGSIKFEVYDIGNSITDASNVQQVYFGDMA